MSGTSVDGIDVACVDLELNGDELRCAYRGVLSTPFDETLRARIVAALPPGLPGAGELCELHAALGTAYAGAFEAAAAALAGDGADFAVLHGQTFFHWVEGGRALGTLQLGNSAEVAERTGLPVIADLRSRDLVADGQGAPMVSMFDQLLLAGRPGPGAAVNLGGIANLTVVQDGRVLTAYDIGPAGALMDAAASWATGGARQYDAGGALAARGQVSAPLLARLKAEPYYALPPPRSTGRELFNAPYLRAMVSGLEPEPSGADICATVTRLLVDLLAEAAGTFGLAELVLSGGGSGNQTTLRWLREAVPGVAVLATDDLGIPAQAKEAVAFAVLGFLSWHGLPGSVTAATGARHPAILGSFQPGAGPLVLPEPAPAPPRYLTVRGLCRQARPPRSSQMAAGFDGSMLAITVRPACSWPTWNWLTSCWTVAGYGGIPSGVTVTSNSTSGSKFMVPTCRMPVITTGQRAVAWPVPAAPAAAAVAAWVCSSIIWLRSAIRACMDAIRSPTGPASRSISLVCFCRSRRFLNMPMGQLSRYSWLKRWATAGLRLIRSFQPRCALSQAYAGIPFEAAMPASLVWS